MKSITLSWLEKKHACPEAIHAFEHKFGKKAAIQEVVDYLHEIGRLDWEAWLLYQTLSLTVAMVECGADIHVCNDLSLCLAAESGRFEVVRYFIEHGVNINNLALCLAADSGRLKIAQYLLEHGANINACEDYTLCLAADSGHTKVVNFLRSIINIRGKT